MLKPKGRNLKFCPGRNIQSLPTALTIYLRDDVIDHLLSLGDHTRIRLVCISYTLTYPSTCVGVRTRINIRRFNSKQRLLC